MYANILSSCTHLNSHNFMLNLDFTAESSQHTFPKSIIKNQYNSYVR